MLIFKWKSKEMKGKVVVLKATFRIYLDPVKLLLVLWIVNLKRRKVTSLHTEMNANHDPFITNPIPTLKISKHPPKVLNLNLKKIMKSLVRVKNLVNLKSQNLLTLKNGAKVISPINRYQRVTVFQFANMKTREFYSEITWIKTGMCQW